MAKSAAKNINSLESQTIVPTATKLGRLIWWGVAIVEPVIGQVSLKVRLPFYLADEFWPLNWSLLGETGHALFP
jgi:hypothetical protein